VTPRFSRKAPRQGTGPTGPLPFLPTPADLHDTRPVPTGRVRSHAREPHQRALPPLTYLLVSRAGWPRLSRDGRPPGSGPACAWGDVASRLNPCPARYRPAFACSRILYPQPHRRALRRAFPRGGELRAYHVPHRYPGGLGRASRPVARHLRQGNAEAPAPGHVPFGPSLSAPYASVLACRTSRPLPALHLKLTVPPAPGPRPPCGAGSRGFGSRLRRQPRG
jgi:hypothetical protein